jgi:hypothetical protein
MANWTGIWEEAEDKLAELLGEHLEGTPHVDELPDIMPTKESCMYVIDFHGGGTAIEPESHNYDTKGSEVGSAREKQIDATVTAIATTKRLARRFAESVWNALPQEPDVRPISRVWVAAEPSIQRGTWKKEDNAGDERRVYKIEATLSVMLYKDTE